MQIDQIICTDALQGLKGLPDKSVHCCVTSPPYFGLRDYGQPGQIGLEETPDAFVQALVEVFEEVRRVLRDDGTLWLNLGDSYASIAGGYNNEGSSGKNSAISRNTQGAALKGRGRNGYDGLKAKDLIGIPWMVAFALRSAGWYLRQDIIWSKPNPMPESVTDRCTKAHEYLFLLSKSGRYYFDQDAIKQTMQDSSAARLSQDVDAQQGSDRVPGKTNGRMKAVGKAYSFARTTATEGKPGAPSQHRADRDQVDYFGTANKRSVWTVTTKPFSEAHFATFPQELIVDCIKAGCPAGGIVLDPFMGAGTTAVVARKLERHFLGFELNPDYIAIANRRLQKELGLFA